MLSSAQCHDICERVLKHSRADATEVWVHSQESALTRFAENTIHQNVNVAGDGVRIRVRVGDRLGSAQANRTDAEALQRLAAGAFDAARLSAEDPDLLPLLGPQEYQDTRAFHDDTSPAVFGPAQRAAEVAKAVRPCAARQLRAAGSYAQEAKAGAVANSAGLFGFHRSTFASFSITAQGDTSTGWASAEGRSVADVDAAGVGARAIEKAVTGQQPREIAPGRYWTLLEPEAAGNMLEFLPGHFNALWLDEGRSCVAGKLGQKLVADAVTIRSDPYHPLQQGHPFDFEGLPRRPLTLIAQGVARELAYDRLTAEKHDTAPTGHGYGGANTFGAYPTDIVMEGGGATVDDMIRATERGLLVTRCWYLRTVDPLKVLVTGMTRDGVFLIEHGTVTRPVRNLRFNESTLTMLQNVEMVGEPVRTGGLVVPPLLVRDFAFTSTTEF